MDEHVEDLTADVPDEGEPPLKEGAEPASELAPEAPAEPAPADPEPAPEPESPGADEAEAPDPAPEPRPDLGTE